MRSPALRLRASFAKLRSERFCWPLSIEAKSTTLLLTRDFVAASGVLPNVRAHARARKMVDPVAARAARRGGARC